MLGRLQQNFFILIILILLSAVVFAQDDSAPIDTLFNEIMLDHGTVIAIDTFGNDWYYDFKVDRFVLGVPSSISDPDNTIDSDLLTLPIEERCTNKIKIKKFSRSATVEVDEFIEGDIFVMDRVTIKGWVKGDVTSFNNRVLISSTGRVDGDVYASNIIIRDGGILNGKQFDAPLNLPDIPTELSDVGVAVIIIIMISLFLFVFLIIALMPAKMVLFTECYNRYTVRTSLLGFLVILLLSPLITLMAITIVGIFLIPLVPLLYIAAILMGIAVFSNNLGKRFTKKILGGERGTYFQTFIGYSFFAIMWILAISLMTASEGSTEQGFGIFFLVVSILITVVPILSGLGAALLTRFGFRKYESWKDSQSGKSSSPAPAPPPIPTVPNLRRSTSPPKTPFDNDN